MIPVTLISTVFAAHLRWEPQAAGNVSAGNVSRSPLTLNLLRKRDLTQSVAVLLYGETFRWGGQHVRTTGTPKSEEKQRAASLSQMEKLILPIQRSGFRVFTAVYSTVKWGTRKKKVGR